MKKVLIATLFFVMVFGSVASANIEDSRLLHSERKTWTVLFSHKIDVNSVNNNTIYIYEESTKKRIPVKFYFSTNKRNVDVEPQVDYKLNEDMVLVVKNIKSDKGKILKNKVNLKFKYVEKESME